MQRLNKNQRRAKRKQKKAKRKKPFYKSMQTRSFLPPVKIEMVEMPQMLPENLTAKQRLAIAKEIGLKAKSKLLELYPTIETWFETYDALYLLSFFSFYYFDLSDGQDPELATEGRIFYRHYIEIMQAFSLIKPRSLTANVLGDNAGKIKETMHDIGEAMMFTYADIPEKYVTEEERSSYMLSTDIMVQTEAVRNWGYENQMKRIVLDLAKLVDKDFKEKWGIGAYDFMSILYSLIERRTVLLNEHIQKVISFKEKKNYKNILNAYFLAFPDAKELDEEGIKRLWSQIGKNRVKLISLLISHSDLRLERVYSFNLNDAKSFLKDSTSIQVLERLIDHLSYEFCDLKGFNKDHIVLNNPVLTKPFIKLNNADYFSVVWSSLPHMALEILENLISEIPALKDRYSNTLKSKYLESQVEQLFKKAFPFAQVLSGSLWDNKKYENDLIILIENFAIVVETKSGKVTPAAKRGAPDRLKNTIQELIIDPSTQALRFIEYLKTNKKIHIFPTTTHGVNNTVDSTKIDYYIPIGVTLSTLGGIGSNLKKLIPPKLISDLKALIPSIPFTCLEVIFEVLDLAAEKIHYLLRRREFEAHVEYEGDELDIFAFYLDNGFNLGEDEFSKEKVFNLIPKSKELDPYFMTKEQGQDTHKPRLLMTTWWHDILHRIADRKLDKGIVISYVLLNMSCDQQKAFEKLFKDLSDDVAAGRTAQQHNSFHFFSGAKRREYLVIGYPYTETNREIRNTIMNQFLNDPSSKNVKGKVIIGINPLNKIYPYNVLAAGEPINLT